MKLKNVSRFFDKTVAKDAYNALSKIKCQIEPLDLFKLDGTRIKMRGLSTAPDVVMPARGVIVIDNQPYLVSDASADQWAGDSVRLRYVIQGADQLAEIRTIPEILADTAGTLAYTSINFNRYGTDERDSSEYHANYHIFFAGTETVVENNIISAGGRFYLVKNANQSTSGLIDALSNEIDSPVIDTATFTAKTYNPVTDSYTDTPSIVRCVRVRWQEHFTYLSQGSAKYERGDTQVFLPLSVTPKAGDTVTLSDGTFTVLSVLTVGGYKSAHLRRA